MVPSLFIGHGSPYLAVQRNEYSQFLQELGRRWRPKAIAIFSAHWESWRRMPGWRCQERSILYRCLSRWAAAAPNGRRPSFTARTSSAQ